MSQETVYQWMEEIARHLPNLGKWQVKGLALFSLGVIWSERSTLTKVAEKLGRFGFQRWISNPRIDITVCLRWWIRWVVKAFDHGHLVLLVDETKLGQQLSIMLVGVAYQSRCIPLVWRCYQHHEGQVKLIGDLLQRVADAVDFPRAESHQSADPRPALCGAPAAGAQTGPTMVRLWGGFQTTRSLAGSCACAVGQGPT